MIAWAQIGKPVELKPVSLKIHRVLNNKANSKKKMNVEILKRHYLTSRTSAAIKIALAFT